MEFCLGTLLVFLVSWRWFNSVPPRAPELPAGVPTPIATVLSWFRRGRPEPAIEILAPPRASTTALKFWLYRTAYASAVVAAYVVLCHVSGVRTGVQSLVDMLSATTGANRIAMLMEAAGHFGLALLLVTVLPAAPPFQGAERSLRRWLYENASIPARQLRERNRLARAPWEPSAATLARVQAELAADGFDPADVVYAGGSATRELWTKLAALMEEVSTWRALDDYATAFAVLREGDGETRSIDRLQEAYDALKSDARACFRAMREPSESLEVGARKELLRHDVRAVLERLYDVLSRVSLHAHFTETQRVESFRDLGFRLGRPDPFPTLDLNDILTLGLLVLLAFTPLLGREDITLRRISAWAAASLVAALIPILLARRYPRLVTSANHRTLPLVFPTLAGLLAAAAGAAISILNEALADPTARYFGLAVGWEKFATQIYPWKTLQFVLGFAIAALTRLRTYPDVARLTGAWRYRSFGSLRDAAIVAGAMTVTLALVVVPMLGRIRGKPFPADWLNYGTSMLIGAVLGFFVPTWYRANLARVEAESAPASPPAVVPAKAA